MTITLSNMPAIEDPAALSPSRQWALARHMIERWVALRLAIVQERLDRQRAKDAELVRQLANSVRKSHPGFAADLDMAADRAVHQPQGGL